MALENLTPENRVESLLSGVDLEPANRLEYFLKQAGSGGGSGSVEYEPVLAETTKSVTEHGWTTSFSGGPIFEGTSYRVTVNGVTYEPLVGTAGDLSYICLGNTYVDDSDPTGDYPFGIFYKNDTLSAWLETGESITMQIDQIIQLVPVPSPAAADTGKVLTANNGEVEWDSEYDILAIYGAGIDTLIGDYSRVLNKLTNIKPVKALYISQNAQKPSVWAYHNIKNFEIASNSIVVVFDVDDVLIWHEDGTFEWT